MGNKESFPASTDPLDFRSRSIEAAFALQQPLQSQLIAVLEAQISQLTEQNSELIIHIDELNEIISTLGQDPPPPPPPPPPLPPLPPPPPGQVIIEYVGEVIPDASTLNDSMNSVSFPSYVGPRGRLVTKINWRGQIAEKLSELILAG